MNPDQADSQHKLDEVEFACAYEGPAPGANRFYVTVGRPGVRISFLEKAPTGQSHFRAAVTLHPSDAVELKEVLTYILRDIDARIVKDDEDTETEG